MKIFITKLEKIDEFIKKIEVGFSCFLLIFMVFVVSIGVFMRYILKNPLVAEMNMATLMLVWLTFFGASAIYKEKGHIALEFLLNRLPIRIRLIISLFVYILIFFTLILTVIQTIYLIKIQWQQQIVALGIPRSVLSLPIFIEGSFMIFTTFRHMMKSVDLAVDIHN